MMEDELKDVSSPMSQTEKIGTSTSLNFQNDVDTNMKSNTASVNHGTILEAAFHDPSPAYLKPPPLCNLEPVELQVNDDEETNDGDSVEISLSPTLESTVGSEPNLSKMEAEEVQELIDFKNQEELRNNVKKKSLRPWKCCGRSAKDAVKISDLSEEELELAKERAKLKYNSEKDFKNKNNRRSRRETRKSKSDQLKGGKRRLSKVPEGLLIYRLDTCDLSVTLISPPNPKTDENLLLRKMIVAKAAPSLDATRRGIVLTSKDGISHTLIACDQQTAISWLESLDIILKKSSFRLPTKEPAKGYLNLVSHSYNLVDHTNRPSSVFYSVKMKSDEPDKEILEEDTMEAIAKRRAIVKDSWDFYRMICSLLRDRRKYQQAFEKLTEDPVYPYLCSMNGLNDQETKEIYQKKLPKYNNMSRQNICADLINQASNALTSLVEICKALAGSLGMEEVGVGPIKELQVAIRKADKKYEGNVLKVTDYCRALLVVKDLSTLLAVLELARDSFGPLIRRVKLSSLRKDNEPLPGGYRDVKINVELKDHICEIQINIWPLWSICGIDGFRHYRHSFEYSIDTFHNPFDALEGLDPTSLAEMIVLAEESISSMPLTQLQWFQEKWILDYFAEVGLFLYHGLNVWAEVTLKALIELRCESPNMGPHHPETLFLKELLKQALSEQNKKSEVKQIEADLKKNNIDSQSPVPRKKHNKSMIESFLERPIFDFALELCADPNQKEREKEEKYIKGVKESKQVWESIKDEKFQFLKDNPTMGSFIESEGSYL